MLINLPISKSIANRVLILQALRGENLMVLPPDTPLDVLVLHDALQALNSPTHPVRINVGNCGTAMRFLTAYCAQLQGCKVILEGSDRMLKRPIGQLVDALTRCGADIWYMNQLGYPPLRITGSKLCFVKHTIDRTKYPLNNPASSQFVSAMLLIGLPVESNSTSPYIRMTKCIIRQNTASITPDSIERDWSSAAFWYEYVALHGGELELAGLAQDTIQGDIAVADIYRQLGVETIFTPSGIKIFPKGRPKRWLSLNFKDYPDLYPAVAVTCRQLGVHLVAWGTEALTIKESDRLQAVKEYKTYGDHRIAMALLAAGLNCDNKDCINKSYPSFYQQLCQLA